MKKITAFLLSFAVICSFFTACKEDKTADSFLAGGVWEAVLKSSDGEGMIIAFKFKEDGTFYFYQSINNNLVITAGGYWEHDDEKEELVLTNEGNTQEFNISCKYSEADNILTLNGPIASFIDGTKDDVEFSFSKLSEEEEQYYKEDATISYNIEKQT